MYDHCHDQQSECCWLGHGDRQRLGGGTQRVPGRTAADRLPKVSAPHVVVGLGVGRSQSLTPHDVVGGIDDAVLVVVAGQRGGISDCRHLVSAEEVPDFAAGVDIAIDCPRKIGPCCEVA